MKVERSFDWKTLEKVAAPYKKDWIGFDAKALVENKRNVLIADDKKNFALFEYEEPGIYYGHYLFTTRGDINYSVAKAFIAYLLEFFPVHIIFGLIPTEHKGAIRLSNKLEFKFNRIVETEAGPHYEVSLTKRKFINE